MNLLVQVRTFMVQAVATPPFGIGTILIIWTMAICTTLMASISRNTLLKCPKLIPIDAHLNTVRTVIRQHIGMAPTVVMRPFRMVTTLIISSAAGCIIHMAIIATITAPLR